MGIRVARRLTRASPGTDGAAGEVAKARSLRPLMQLYPHVARHRRMVALAAVALVLSAGAMLSIPLAMRRMIDFGFTGIDGHLIDRYFVGLIALGVLLALASATRFFAVNWLGERVVADLRTRVFGHLATLSPAVIERQRSGELMSRITADTTQITAAAGSAISQAVRNTIMLTGAFAMMFVTSARLSLLVLFAIPLIVLPLVGYGRTVRRLASSAQDTLAGAMGYAAENLAAHRTMQASTNEAAVTARYAGAIEQAFAAVRARLLARAGLTALVIALVFAGIVGVLWHGAGLVMTGALSVGQLGQFVLYAIFAGSAMAGLSEVWGEVQQAAGAAERIAELMATPPGIASPEHPTPLPSPPEGRISFEHVAFRYPGGGDVPALTGLDIEIRQGETVALVGPSGAGKSTVLALLLRFFDPGSGVIRFDGVPLPEADLGELRRRMALVPQDVALFADTVAANIAYGAPGASREAIVQAAIAARADAFIRALPLGYDTVLGERGVTLSGGQRQRIAIARAILRDAPVLLLDEATSALDAESEAAIQQALDALRRGRTTLVVAHRLATVQRADRILVMDGGRIVEEGTHTSLVAKGGLYARLAELQFGLADAAQ
jgi:ATP-binding cassette subfamily B protein